MTNLIFKRLVFHLPYRFLRPIPQLQKTPFISTAAGSDSDLEPPTISINVQESSSSSSLSSFTVKYLTNSCGLSLQDALSASKKFQLVEYKSHKYESVLALLRSFQFNDTHIKKLLVRCTLILKFNVHKNLKPKLEYLTQSGFVGPHLPELIVANPAILHRSLSDFIKPSMEILRKYIKTNGKVIAAVKRGSWLLSSDLKEIMLPNVEFLLSEGVTASAIESLIVWQARALLVKLDKFVTAVENVKKLGLKPCSSTCVQAIRLLVSISETTWKRKVDLFKSLGWSEEEIMSAFKREPLYLAGSEEKIRSIMDFYVNTMKLTTVDIAVYPKLLMYGLNTRIRPRYNVLKVLESKKLLKKRKKLVWTFTLAEKDFMEKFIDKHLDQVPKLMELYRGTITSE